MVDLFLDHWPWLIPWWALGTTSVMWLRRGDPPLTWGVLVGCLGLGILGPLLWVMIIFAIVQQMDFWHEPIFRKKNKTKVTDGQNGQ